jgi:hypothetical protein
MMDFAKRFGTLPGAWIVLSSTISDEVVQTHERTVHFAQFSFSFVRSRAVLLSFLLMKFVWCSRLGGRATSAWQTAVNQRQAKA